MLGRPDADGAARKGGAARRRQQRSGRGRARRRARCARSAGSRKPTPPTATRRGAAPNDAGHQDRVGRAVPREIQQGRSAEVVSDGAAGRLRSGRRRSSARRARSPTTIRRRRSTLAKQALEINPVVRRRARLPRRRGGRLEQARRGARGAGEGAGRQPVEPRRASRCWRRSPTSRTSRRSSRPKSAKALAIAPSYGEVYRVAGELAARNYRFDEAVDADAPRPRARRRSNPRVAGRPRHRTCCAPATSRRPRPRSKRSFKLDPFNKLDQEPAGHDGHARQVRHRPRRRL